MLLIESRMNSVRLYPASPSICDRIFTGAAWVRSYQLAGSLPRSPGTRISVCSASTTSASPVSHGERGVNLRRQHVRLGNPLLAIGVCWLDQHFCLAVMVVPCHRCFPVSKGRELTSACFLAWSGLAACW